MTARPRGKGRCTHCGRHRDVFTIGRKGGGTYRRGGRTYTSSICGPCAVGLLSRAGTHAGASADRYSVGTLRDIVAAVDPAESARYEVRYTIARALDVMHNDERRGILPQTVEAEVDVCMRASADGPHEPHLRRSMDWPDTPRHLRGMWLWCLGEYVQERQGRYVKVRIDTEPPVVVHQGGHAHEDEQHPHTVRVHEAREREQKR